MKNRKRKPRHFPKPAVGSEVLEVRQLLSSNSVVVSFNRAAQTLTVVGSEDADHISITQNDAMRTLTVVTSQVDRPEITQQFPVQMIDRIMLRLGAGDDQFEYKTVGRVRTAKDISLNLGSGDDTAGIAWAEDGSMSVASLSLNVTAGDGSDAVGARIGRVRGNVKTSVNVDLGSGDDGFAAEALNPTGFRSALSVNVSLRGQNRPRMCGLKPATEGIGYVERFQHGSAGRARDVQSAVHGHHSIDRDTAPIRSFEPGNCSNIGH